MKTIIIINKFYLILIFAFALSIVNAQNYDESVSKRYENVAKHNVNTTWKLPSKEQTETFNILGLEYFGQFTIDVKSKNTHYIIFLAVTNTSEHDSIPRIISFENLHSCFLFRTHPDYNDTTYYETINQKLIFDKKMASIQNNDSIYLSLNGIDYDAVPNLTGYLAERPILDTKTRRFEDNEIISLFYGSFQTKEEEKRVREFNDENNSFFDTGGNYFMLGTIFYDCKKDNIKDIIESPIFARYIREKSGSDKLTKEDCIKYKDDIRGYYRSRKFN